VIRYVAGIDGGQSSTAAVVGDERGRVVGWGRAGAADEVGERPGSTRLRAALEDALEAALRFAGLPADTPLAAVVAGVSGYEGRLVGAAPRFATPHFLLMHDAPAAHAGALAGRDGVTVVAGSGSVVYATAAGSALTLGGWGFVFGDEGSAFWLVRQALAELMRAQDGREADAAGDAATFCAFFEEPSLRRVARAFYAGGLGRDRLAAAAPLVLENRRFGAIVDAGTAALAALASVAVGRGAPPEIAVTGGLLQNAGYRDRLATALRERVPGAVVVEPRYDPAEGALLLAYRAAGLPVPELRR